jgi:hypothetical protein
MNNSATTDTPMNPDLIRAIWLDGFRKGARHGLTYNALYDAPIAWKDFVDRPHRDGILGDLTDIKTWQNTPNEP